MQQMVSDGQGRERLLVDETRPGKVSLAFTSSKRESKRERGSTYTFHSQSTDEPACRVSLRLEHSLELDEDRLASELGEDGRLVFGRRAGERAQQGRGDVDVDPHGSSAGESRGRGGRSPLRRGWVWVRGRKTGTRRVARSVESTIDLASTLAGLSSLKSGYCE